jgi:hypothetical protein
MGGELRVNGPPAPSPLPLLSLAENPNLNAVGTEAASEAMEVDGGMGDEEGEENEDEFEEGVGKVTEDEPSVPAVAAVTEAAFVPPPPPDGD